MHHFVNNGWLLRYTIWTKYVNCCHKRNFVAIFVDPKWKESFYKWLQGQLLCPLSLSTHQLRQVKYIRGRGAYPQSAGQAPHRLSSGCSHLCLLLLPVPSQQRVTCPLLSTNGAAAGVTDSYTEAKLADKPVLLLWVRDPFPQHLLALGTNQTHPSSSSTHGYLLFNVSLWPVKEFSNSQERNCVALGYG